MRDERIGFRPVEIERDLADLLRWLGDPEVRRWYDEGELSEANIGRKFAPEPHMRKLIILIDGTPVGYIQVYRLADEEDYRRQVDVSAEAVAMDLFIGEAAYRGKGWGTDVIRACLVADRVRGDGCAAGDDRAGPGERACGAELREGGVPASEDGVRDGRRAGKHRIRAGDAADVGGLRGRSRGWPLNRCNVGTMGRELSCVRHECGVVWKVRRGVFPHRGVVA